MKKIITILSISILTILFGYLLYGVFTKIHVKEIAAQRIEVVPNFKLQSIDSTSFSRTNLMLNKQTVFVFFNSQCDFCQHEAQSIHDELYQFKDVQLLFISSEPHESIASFASQYQLHKQPNITFLHDNNSLFSTELDIQSIPTVLIYNKQQKLLKKHKGQLNAHGILKVINKH